MNLSQLYLIAGVVLALGVVLGGVYKLSHWIRLNNRVWDQIKGVEASRGVPALPSMVERITGLEDKIDKVIEATAQVMHAANQLLPNGGSSIADAVRQIQNQMSKMDNRLEDHIKESKERYER